MKLLWALLRRRRALSLSCAALSILSVALTLWWNERLRAILDEIALGAPASADNVLSAAAALLCVAAVGWGLGLLTGWTCESLAHDLRLGYARHYTRLSVEETARLNAGAQLSRLQNEIGGVSDYLRDHFFQLFGNAARFVGTLLWLMWLDPLLTLAAYLPLIPIVWYVARSSKIIEGATRKSRQAQEKMNGCADALLTLFPLIRLYDAARLVRADHERALGAWEEASIREERTRAKLMSLSALLSCLPLLLLLLAGGHMVIGGRITLGTLYIFVNLSGNVSGVMMNMPGFIAAFRRFTVDMERLRPAVALGEED